MLEVINITKAAITSNVQFNTSDEELGKGISQNGLRI